MATDTPVPASGWKQSRYCFWATLKPGSHLLLGGATGALYELDDDERREVERRLDLATPRHGDPLDDLLVEGGMWVPADLDEPGALLAGARDDGLLALTLVPTLECNFRCGYCYVDFQPGRMAPEVAARIVRFARRMLPGRSALEVCWFGGEPLLEAPLVLDLTAKLGAVAEAAGVPWRGMVATNGWLLLPQTGRRLRSAGVRYFHVTVDGPARHHDRLRPLCGGQPTFARLLANVRALLDGVPDAELTLRLNADESNADDLGELLHEIPAHHRGRVQVNPTEIRRCDLLPEKPLRRRLNRTVRRALEMGYRYYDNAIPTGRKHFCHADSSHHFQIGPTGTVYRCSPSSTKPEVEVGHLDGGGELRLDERDRRWQAVPQISSGCRDCPYLCFCPGGCRLHRLRGSLDPSCRSRFEDDMEGLIINRYLAAIQA